MILEQAFANIHETLQQHYRLWSEEVIIQYPQCFEIYPEEWLREFSELDLDSLYLIEQGKNYNLISSPSLRKYFETCLQLSSVDQAKTPPAKAIGPHAYNGITAKKKHEIDRIAPLIAEFAQTQQLSKVLDCCGGIGYLAQILSQHYQLDTTCVDFDEKLQATGKQRFARSSIKNTYSLSYLNADLHEFVPPPDLSREQIGVGLHTCGSLANAQLNLALQLGLPAIINFACCYSKAKTSDFKLSKLGKRYNLHLTEPGLTLASRSHRDSKKAYYFSKQVKKYRYAFHLFLYREMERTEFLGLGTSPKSLYEGSFTEYAEEQLKRLKIIRTAGIKEQIDTFYDNSEVQKTVHKMVIANVIRAPLGRLIELYVILDRALYLSEHGYRVKVNTYFDERISPRNIGITAAII